MAGVHTLPKPDDWVFASPATSGKKPVLGTNYHAVFIRPAAVKIGIAQHIGWHTFGRTSALAAQRKDNQILRMVVARDCNPGGLCVYET